MTAVLDRVPVERITSEARDIAFGRVVLTVIAAILYGVGWVAAKTVGVLAAVFGWLGRALVWAGVAVKVGWQEARAPGAGRGVTA